MAWRRFGHLCGGGEGSGRGSLVGVVVVRSVGWSLKHLLRSAFVRVCIVQGAHIRAKRSAHTLATRTINFAQLWPSLLAEQVAKARACNQHLSFAQQNRPSKMGRCIVKACTRVCAERRLHLLQCVLLSVRIGRYET